MDEKGGKYTLENDTAKTEHILSLSYGKDSLACLGAIEEIGWPLDRIVHAEVWATDTIPADLPPMVEFKAKADRIIKERWGIEVEHVCAMTTYEDLFYKIPEKRKRKNTDFDGKCRGFPFQKGAWCQRDLKVSVLDKPKRKKTLEQDVFYKIRKTGKNKNKKGCVQYIGIAVDEPNRFGQLSELKKSPLVEAGWDEAYCRKWCEENDLLSPIYTTATRGGCWFCHNQGVAQLRLLRKNYPDLWALMLKWDADSPVSFKPAKKQWIADPNGTEIQLFPFDVNGEVVERVEHGYWKNLPGCTVHDFDRRFQLEDEGFIYQDDTVFRWSMLEEELNYRWF